MSVSRRTSPRPRRFAPVAAAALTVALALGGALPAPAEAEPGADSTAIAPPAAFSDSAAASALPRGLGVADTVTLLPPVRVHDARPPISDRSTATTVRLDRSGVVRFVPATVNDALAAVPGVELVKLGPWASRLSLRGLSGDRVLVLVDGVRLNTVRGHGGQSSLVSVDRIDAVELVPGATSAQFGSDALGGVVNLVTQRSLFETRTVADVTLTGRGSEPGDGNAQQLRGRVRAAAWGVELAGGFGALDALSTPRGRLPNSGYREDHYSGRGAARLGAVVFDYEHTRQAAHDVGLPAFNGTAGSPGTGGFAGIYPLQSRDADRLELSLPPRGGRPEARLLGVLQTQRTYFTETTTDSTYRLGRLVRTATTEARDRVTSRGASLQPIVRFEGRGGLRLGGEYRHESAGGPRESATAPVTYPLFGDPTPQPSTTTVSESVPPARRDVWSGSAFVRPRLGRVRLETGVRYDWVRSHADSTPGSPTARLDATDERWSAEAGLSGTIRTLEPYAHVATGFRVPNLDERYYNDEIHGGLRLFGNPDLRSESSRSFELGVRAAEGGPEWLPEARISVYRSEVENLISFRYVTTVNLVPRFQYFNLRDAQIDGIELQSRLRLQGLGLGLNAGFPRGIDTETGKRILDVGTGRVTLDVTVPAARVLPMGQFAARLRWNDAVRVGDRDPQQQLLARDAFWIASIEASAAVGGVRTTFAVRNLLDHYYFEPLSFIPEGGRTFALSLRRDFNLPLGMGRREP